MNCYFCRLQLEMHHIMRITRLLFFIFILVQSTALAQTKEILFSVDNHPYYTDEFIRVYNKNLDLVKDDSQKNLDNYLELFIGYKLKVEKANKIGLQNSVNYQNELKSYRTQLSKNYLSDSKVTNELVQEAYDRMKQEIRASHILVLIDESASPEDTLKAYQKIVDIKKRIDSGEDFITLAQQFSEDPSVKENNGDLGYFSAFRMVYSFENAAFSTEMGQTSKPFRTRFGYHIVKVFDKRMNRGEVSVAHIMILKPSDPAIKSEDKSKQTIEDIDKIARLRAASSNIENLTNQLNSEVGANLDKILKVLKLMTEISIYKEALNMKTHANILPDKNAPERRYLQVRGAVPFEKGDRAWVGHYMGRIESNDKKIRIDSYIKDEGRYEVIKKVVEKLKIKNGL